MDQSKREAVQNYLIDEIGVEELKEKIGQKAAETVQESREQLNQAEELAEELSKL
ncbi:hypothetical protein [Salinirussus salinus]|uniref:hypothetical protein n=1 Tax=Salinirussus salinus TaxID=1198300 RepID=UPI0013588299|nr:hypothetical protein [Salinirussus salinus]